MPVLVPFLMSNFIYDLKNYGIAVAWYNFRFLIGTGLAKAIIRHPMYFHVHDGEECDKHPVYRGVDH